MAPRGPFQLDSLLTAIPTILDQVQISGTSHKKNCVSLYKLHLSAATVVESTPQARGAVTVKYTGEKSFAEAIIDVIHRALVVKRGVPAADRVIKFIGGYVKYVAEKDKNSTEEETISSRFISRLLTHLMKGLAAKNKDVRYRVVSLVSELVAHLGEVDEDLYMDLRTGLLERLHDKESFIRSVSVAALSKLAGSEDPNDVEDGKPILVYLLESLCDDPSPEVRRAALIHVPLTPETLPAVLSRCRDVDAVTRKLVYSAVLSRLAHPKQLSIAQREHVVKQGLGDREQGVRLAAAKLLAGWLDLCEGDFVRFLELFDVRCSTDISVDALKSVFVTRADVVNGIDFDDQFWSTLQPETALLARTFVEHCISTEDQERLESALPVLTALSFLTQKQYNVFVELTSCDDEDLDEEEKDRREDKLVDCEFILCELLQLAIHLDYGDEIGRRKLSDVVREMLTHPALPEPLLKPCMSVLEKMSASERDLIRVVVEIINELRDRVLEVTRATDLPTSISDPDAISTTSRTTQPHACLRPNSKELSPEEKAHLDTIDLHCLDICIAVLERVNNSFEENSTLEGILADLVIPAVKRKELVLREKGLVCLGLCCLLTRNMALSSFQLFLNQVKSAPESLRARVIQIIFDIMMTYDKDLFVEGEEMTQKVIAFLMQVLEAEESKQVQALICLGLSKLMLFGLLTDERVLISLVLAYVSPVTVDNQELRQSLAYFLNAYCHSSPLNQSRMQRIFLTAYDLVVRVYDDLEDDQNMITPLQFGQLLIDWTDPSRIIKVPGVELPDSQTHLQLAVDILKALYDVERSPDEKKRLCAFLMKLNLPEEPPDQLLYALHLLSVYLPQQCPFEDSTLEKQFMRFTDKLSKLYESRLSSFDVQDCFDDENYRDLHEFMGVNRRNGIRLKTTNIDHSKGNARKNSVRQSRLEDRLEKTSEASSDPDVSGGQEPKLGRKVVLGMECGSDEEVGRDGTSKETPQPSTPPRKRAPKRQLTPTKTPSRPSPAHKKQIRVTRQRNGNGNSTKHRVRNGPANPDSTDDDDEATSEGTSAVPPGRRPKQLVEDISDESDDM